MTGEPADDELTARLRAAGCVFAEEEAAVLRRWASSPAEVTAWAARRCAGEPIEHIVGRVDFGGLVLAVGPGVFVPRQRSALLASEAADLIAARPGTVFVEACCGVAPLASVVADRLPGVEIVAADADPRAVEFAAVNVPGARVAVGRGLAVLPADLLGRVGVVAAVPPYVPDGEARLLPAEAVDHEPSAALFGGPDGLVVARELLAEAARWLAPGGAVALELHRDQAAAAAAHAASLGFAARTVTADDGHTTALVAVHRP